MAESDKQSPTLPSHQDQPVTPVATGRGLAWFCLLLVIALTAIGGWGGYQQQQALLRVQGTIQQQQQQLDAMSQQQRQRQGNSEQLHNAFKQLREQQQEDGGLIEQLTQQLQHFAGQLQAIDGRASNDWLVAEADYLVRMAGRKIWLERDLRTAMMLLGNAEERLAQLGDPAVLAARAAIAADLHMLQHLNPVSRTSIALSLSALHKQIEQLPLAQATPSHAAPSAPLEQTDSLHDWRHNLSIIWQDLLDTFIRISWQDTPVTPLLSEQAEWLVREQVKLLMVNAQHAALHAQPAVYKQSISTAISLLNTHFLNSDPAVQAVVSGLTQLVATDVSQPLPTELSAQQPLEQLMHKSVSRVFGTEGGVL